MSLDRKVRNLIKVSLNVFILFLLLHLFITPVSATDYMSLNINSVFGENFSSKVLIDTKGISNADLVIGDEQDYSLLNLTPPVFFKSFYVALTNLYEGDKRVAYVKSEGIITAIKFNLVLKLNIPDKTVLQSFYIVMPVPVEKHIESFIKDPIDEVRDYTFSFIPFYRNTKRDLKVGSDNVSSEVSLLITRLELNYKKKYAIFFDLGYGILSINDGVTFSGLNPYTNMDSYDGGRSFAYGSGVNATILNTKMLDFEVMLHVTRFKSETEANSLKIINSKSEVLWSEYMVQIGTTVKINKYFNPLVAATYSEIVGDFEINQVFLSTSSSEKKTLDEDGFLGVTVGFVSKPFDELYLSVTAEIVNQTGYKIALIYNF